MALPLYTESLAARTSGRVILLSLQHRYSRFGLRCQRYGILAGSDRERPSLTKQGLTKLQQLDHAIGRR